jgi:hypothetical protein
MHTRSLFLAALLGVAAVASPATASPAAPAAPAAANPAVRHVFVIVLENEDAEVTFGPGSPAPYLATTLPSQGQLIEQYFGTAHLSLGNYIAMVSGQAPNPQTQSDCQTFTDFAPPAAVIDPNGQAVGQGCVYPADVPTVADQLEAAGFTWRGYMDGMGAACRHPAVGAQDDTQAAEVGDQYATRHNPFMYFHSIIDDVPSCEEHVVDLTNLSADLQNASSTRNLSFITPDLCDDGHDEPCVDGRPGGLVSADEFLRTVVPQILDSPAFKADGMLVINFDEAEFGSPAGAAACCGELPGPNSPLPGINGLGGGRTGAVVLSPFTEPGTVNQTPYNHYSLLRSIEDLFGLDHLGFAAASGLQAFGADVFNAGAAQPTTTTTAAAAPSTTAPTAASPRRLPTTGGAPPLVPLLALAAAALAVLTLRPRPGRHPSP